MNSGEPDEDDPEKGAIQAAAKTRLRTRLMAAELLHPDRATSEDAFALDKKLRWEAQQALDTAILRHRLTLPPKS